MSTTTMLESLAWSQSFKGYDLTKQKSPGHSHAISRVYRNSIFMLYSVNKQVPLLPHGASHGIFHRTSVSENFFKRSTLNVPSWKGLYRPHWERLRTNVAYDVAGAVEVINDLGLDTLTFLAVTVIIVPTFKSLKASPILGFFCAGVVLNQFGLIRNLTDVKVLSEWGILFLLFEMGLELSLARLKALAKYAFGMGLAQVVLSTLAFTAFELPPNGAVGTKILEYLFHSRPDLVNIRSIDEAVVIGAALSLSSSAFVLQDLAVVPLLVILPILESQ
ncbi:K(+) efflux antiporter 3, chloroplastic, partial [Mucuna pruriens]